MEDGTYIYVGPRLVNGQYVSGVRRRIRRLLVEDGSIYDFDTGEILDPIERLNMTFDWKYATPFPLKK